MTQDDPEVQEFVRQKSQRMMRAALLARLHGIVSLWRREEQGKTRVVRGAIAGCIVLLLVTALVALWEPSYGAYALLAGFLAWVAHFLVLMRKHLGERR
jgi:Na+/H+ antiporter NhaC